MSGKIASAVLVGLFAFASARPAPASKNFTSPPGFRYPLPNGFPITAPGSPQLKQIEEQALGTLPNGNPPSSLQPASITGLGFIAFNELFEVAFFKELIDNITLNVPGYDHIPDRERTLSILRTSKAQEELHELNGNGAFQKFTGKTIQPCEYNFPVDNFEDAIGLTATFTDVVLGTLPDIQTILSQATPDSGLIRAVGSVIGQEGEQNGFYRNILGKNPAALPFLTASSIDFAFSAINQNFVVPGSCPSLDLLEPTLKIFDLLSLVTPGEEITSSQDSTLEYTFQTTNSTSPPSQNYAQESLYLTYVNQQNVPFSVPIQITGLEDNGAVSFTAPFPGQSQEMNGLTIAALTNCDGPFATVDDVAAATIFGPALIEVN